MLIRTNSRKEIVRRQKMIIDFVDKKSRSIDGVHPTMKEAMSDYGDVCKKGKLGGYKNQP